MRFAELMEDFRNALVDPSRRDVVLAALKVRERLAYPEAVKRYVQQLAVTRKRKGGENASGRNSHAENTRLVLLKLGRVLKLDYIDQLTPLSVQEYLDSSPLSPKTLRNHAACLSGLGSWAKRLRYIGEHPTADVVPPPVPVEEIVYIPKPNVPKVLAAVKDTSVEVPVALALLAGLRRCEIVRLEPRDIDWASRSLKVRAAASKTGRARVVPISASLEAILRRRGCLVGERVALNKGGRPWNPEKLTRRTMYYLSRAGYSTVTYNVLRHTFVTHQLASGVDVWKVAKWSGHSVIVLEKHYGAHVHHADDAEIVDVVAV